MALVVFGWMTAMRLVRSSVVSIRGSDYVLAAQALGASSGGSCCVISCPTPLRRC